MGELVGRMQTQIKKTSSDLMLFSVKFLTGAILGLTFALILEVVLGYRENENLIVFLLAVSVTTAVFLRISRAWGMTATLVFDLICVLVGMLLKLYVMIGARA